MKKGSIGVLDSGVGGLSLLKMMNNAFEKQSFIYYGDNENNPYGSKTVERLTALTRDNVLRLISAGATSVVFGCNTLSLSVLPKIKSSFDIPLFGVFPPVESARGNKSLLLATPLTVSYFKNHDGLTAIGLKDLAREVEENVFCLNDIDIEKHISSSFSGYDNLILGCTHYFFVKKQIINHLKPLNVIDGLNNTVDELSKKLNIQKTLAKTKENSIKFLGACAKRNEKVWDLVVKNLD